MARRPSQQMFVGFIGILFVALTAGCNAWPEKDTSGASTWTEKWRTERAATGAVGVDPRAKEIERNLGVR